MGRTGVTHSLLVATATVALWGCAEGEGGDQADAPLPRPTILLVDAAGDVSRMLRLDPEAEEAEVVRAQLADGSRGLTLDRREGILYWASRDADRIQFGRWNDASISDLPLTGLDSAYAVEFVREEDALYWSDYGTDAIHRLSLAGGAPEAIVSGLVAPRQIALDREGGFIYWVDRGAGTVQRATWDGGDQETLISGMAAPYGIALDRSTGTLLVGDAEVGAIYRVDPDPAEGEPILEDWLPQAGTHPSFLAVDDEGGMLYWTDNRDNVLRRRSLEGGPVETLISELAGPRGLVLIR